MRPRLKVLFPIIFILIISVFGLFFLKEKVFDHHKDNLINITKLSKKFMDDYFREYQSLEQEEKEDLLIVISSKKIKSEDYGAKKVIETPNHKYYLLFEDDVTKQNAIQKLNSEEFVRSVESNITREAFVDENESTTYNSWGIEAMGLDYATEIVSNLDTQEVVVAIIDTGLDTNLFNKYYNGKLKGTYNVLDSSDSMFDNFGHGTHIAGTIAEGTPNNVKILPVKISDQNTMLETDILAGIEYITYYTDVDVVNMSFGGYEYSDAEYQAIEAAKEQNIVLVAAAGNEETSNPSYPASFDNTISIASVDSNLERSYFSNFGETIDFSAPGGSINSLMASYMGISAKEDGDDDHETISGTSMATPHAVSAVAILKSVNKSLSLEDTIDLLKQNALDLGGRGYDIYYGNGFISYKDVIFCTDTEMSCDDYNIFKVMKPTSMTIDEIAYTNYNYGSLSNIMGTTISFEEADGYDFTKKLWELDDVTITGYNPYSSEEQNINIQYLDLNLSVAVHNPENYESGWEYELYNEKYYLSGYKDSDLNIGKLYFPETIDGFTMSGILNSNDNHSRLFYNSNNANYLEEVFLPSNITEIGSYAFDGLSNCTKVTSMATELIVSNNSFSNMPSLTVIEGNISFTETSISVFENDISLSMITISESTFDILPPMTFMGCSSLKSIILPNSITTIGYSAFEESGLKSVELPNQLRIIQRMAFYNSQIKNIIFPESLEELGGASFFNNDLKTITIPKNVSVIDGPVFAYNPSLDNITVSEENDFYDSRDESNLIIETATNKIIQGSNHPTIPSSVKIIGDRSFSGLSIQELNVPEGVTTIEEHAFLQSSYFEKIILPNSLTYIDPSVFSYPEPYNNLLAVATSGAYTGLGTTALWVHLDSYAYDFAINHDTTYVVIEDSDNVVTIAGLQFKFQKYSFYPGEKIDDYVDWIKYYYYEGDELLEVEVEDYTVEYQNGDSVSEDDFAAFIYFNIDHSYHNIRIPVYIFAADDLELPAFEAVLGQYICNYNYPDGFFEAYDCVSYDEPGDYTIIGNYTLNDSGEKYYGAKAHVHVVNKELVYDHANQIITKVYDGTTYVDPNNIILYSVYSNLEPKDYTIESATLSYPDVQKQSIVTIRAKIKDEAYEHFAFAGNEQEIEFMDFMTVTDFQIPEVELLKNEEFFEACFEDGCLRGYGSSDKLSFDEAGDYTIIGYYAYNDGSGMIENLLIPIHVIDKQFVNNWAEILPKTYDGTTNVDFNTINLSGLNKNQYSIISAQLLSPDVDEMSAVVLKIRLNDEAYENYAFTGNKQELEWWNPIVMLKAKPLYDVPSNLQAELGQYLYDVPLPSGFEWMSENELLSETGEKEFLARFIPEDTTNYEVAEDITIKIEVLAKIIPYTSSDYEGIYDEQDHTIGINVDLDSYDIKYSTNGVDYTLDELPVFHEVGEYTIYYKISAQDYEELEGSNKVKIYGIKEFDSTITKKDNVLVVDDFSFGLLKNKITAYSTKTEFIHLDSLGNTIEENGMKTGDQIKVIVNDTPFIYQIAVRGDVDCDGEIGIIDYIRIMKDIMDDTKLTGLSWEAADMNQNNEIDIIDYIRIMKIIMEEN